MRRMPETEAAMSDARTMGPREERWRRALDILDDPSLEIAQKHNEGVRPIIIRLRLADALEEALRIIWDDDKSSAFEHGGYDRLRALLAEVDRG
jgi:hypothetical protein